MSKEIERLKARYERAKAARKEAESLLEQKSRDLYLLNNELKALAESLEQKVVDRTKALSAAKDEAERLSQVKSTFLANMSHELRTPLNGVLGMLSILSQSNLSEHDQKHINTASNSGNLLLKIINSILDFTKLETDKIDLESIEYDPLDLLESTLNSFYAQSANKNIKLISCIEPTIPNKLIGDPTRLRQIVTNLVSNAIKFTSSGHVTLTAQHINDRLTIAISDTGIGISADIHENIFSAFAQADETTTRKFGGTGLGLAISQQLAQLMKGTIEVLSTQGKGSTFTLDIPAEPVYNIDNSHPNINLSDQSIAIAGFSENIKTHLSTCFTHWQAEDLETFNDLSMLALYLQNFTVHTAFIDVAITRNTTDFFALLNNFSQVKFIVITYQQNESLLVNNKHQSNLHTLSMPFRLSQLSALLGFEVQALSQAIDETNVFTKYRFNKQKILLAEDNRTNQEVAKALLSMVNLNVDIVDNGQKALDAIVQQQYDLVLMDIQMPIMDGLTATQSIRNLGGAQALIPIVAMTAHSLKGDREKSLQAGMNEHITKPIEPAILYSTIAKFISPLDNQPPIEKTKLLSHPNHTRAAEHTAENTDIDINSAFQRLGSNSSLYVKLLKMFDKQKIEFFNDVNKQLSVHDFESAVRTAHTLKGSAANLGAIALSKNASKLEQTLKPLLNNPKQNASLQQNLIDEITPIIHQIETDWKHFANASKDYCNKAQ